MLSARNCCATVRSVMFALGLCSCIIRQVDTAVEEIYFNSISFMDDKQQ